MNAVIWDMDGVLVNTGPFHFRAWRRILGEHGRGLAEKEFLENFGMKSVEILHRVLGDLPAEELRRLALRKEEYYRQEIAGHLEPLPGARNLLEALGRAGFRQALASSAPHQNIGLVLEAMAMAQFFEAIVSGDDVAVGKPHPGIFLEAAARLGVPPARSVVMEDAVAGVRAAKAAGMRCVAVTNSNPREKLAEADLVVASLEEVSPQVVEEMLGQGDAAHPH